MVSWARRAAEKKAWEETSFRNNMRMKGYFRKIRNILKEENEKGRQEEQENSMGTASTGERGNRTTKEKKYFKFQAYINHM